MTSLRDKEAGREAGRVAPCFILGVMLSFHEGVVETPSSAGVSLHWN